MLYYYHDHDYNVLPLAKDGHLDYGLLTSMRALDIFKKDGDDYKKQNNTGDPDEGWVDV